MSCDSPARDGLAIHEALDVQIGRLDIRAPSVTGHLTSGESARFVTDEFTFSNPGFTAAAEPGSGTGIFEVRSAAHLAGHGRVRDWRF